MSAPKHNKIINRTILAITDFTKSSNHAILFATNLFENINFKFKLLNVYETPNENALLLISIEDILRKDSELGLKKQAGELVAILDHPNPVISTHSIAGKLKKAINAITQSDKIDLIVAGIPSDTKQSKKLNNTPLLLISQSKVPLLLVPEKCPDHPIETVIIVSLDSRLPGNVLSKEYESLVNHDHISPSIFYLNEQKPNKQLTAEVQEILLKRKNNLIVVIPSPGDIIDIQMIDFQPSKIYSAVATLLEY